MKKNLCFSTILILSLTINLMAQSSIKANENYAIVTATNLNVRVRPEVNSDMVAKLKKGTGVEVLEKKADWTKIKAPNASLVYVFSKFVKDGKTTQDVNLRTGAGTNYQSYGIIPVGTRLQVQKVEDNGWTKVAPLSTMFAFVSTKFLTFQAKVEPPKVEEQKTIMPTDEQVNEFKENFIPGSQIKIDLRGKIVACKTSNESIFSYALKTQESHYFLIGNVPASYLRQNVEISGIASKIKGWKNQVLEIENIKLIK